MAMACPQHIADSRTLRDKGAHAFFLAFLLQLAFCSAEAQDSMDATSHSSVMAAQAASAPAPHVQQHNSNVLAYWYGATYRTPFVVNPNTGKASDIPRSAIEFTHAGSTGLLNSFADVTVSQSSMAEPAASGGSGATELYAILRAGASLNELTRSATFRKGPLRDLSFEAGANLETKNSSYAPAERTLYIGPKFEFALPHGFFNVGLHYRKEWNHEGVLGKAENYDPNFNIEPTWAIPFTLGKAHLAYSGFADYNSQKGKDSFGSQTVPEFLIRNVLSLDIGAALFRRAQLLDLSGGFWYWHNEYGKSTSNPGAEQMTPLIGLVLHLDGGHPIRRD